jgi:hypothetical protein
MRYEKNPARNHPYTISTSESSAAPGEFAVRRFEAQRSGPDVLLLLTVCARVEPGRHLAAVVGYRAEDGHSRRWSLPTRTGGPKVLPLLLGGSGQYELRQEIRLASFPLATRVRLEFYEVAPDRDAEWLGRVDAEVRS